MTHHVFICHPKQNKEIVENLAAEYGVRAMLDTTTYSPDPLTSPTLGTP
jgi:hypothetical protein